MPQGMSTHVEPKMGKEFIGRTFTRSEIKAACAFRDRLGFETHLVGGGNRPWLECRGIIQSHADGFMSESSAAFRFVGVAAEELWRLEEVYQPWFVRALRTVICGAQKQEQPR